MTPVNARSMPKVWSTAIATDSQQWMPQNDPFTNEQPLPSPGLGPMSPGIGTVIGDDGDEVISTAVVVKNIPFSLKKETLLELFVRSNVARF